MNPFTRKRSILGILISIKRFLNHPIQPIIDWYIYETQIKTRGIFTKFQIYWRYYKSSRARLMLEGNYYRDKDAMKRSFDLINEDECMWETELPKTEAEFSIVSKIIKTKSELETLNKFETVNGTKKLITFKKNELTSLQKQLMIVRGV